MTEAELRERLAQMAAAWFDDEADPVPDIWGAFADAVLAEIAAAGFVIMDRGRVERLRAYVVADEEYGQSSTWAGVWSDDEVVRAAVNLQYVGREKRRRDAHHAITLGDLDPIPERTDGE